MGKKKRKPMVDAAVTVYPFGVGVAIFTDQEEAAQYFEKVHGIHNHGIRDRTGIAFAGRLEDDDGRSWFFMVLPKGVSLKIVVHECSHIIDFVMDLHGVPINVENTEMRAYLLADLFDETCKALDLLPNAENQEKAQCKI